MTLFITLLLSIGIICVLFYLFSRLNTPYYRVDEKRMIHVLEMVLTGQATDNDWQMTFGMVIRHSPTLEAIRCECVVIEDDCYIGTQRPPYLFSSEGLVKLKPILQALKTQRVQ